jgi:tRNA modification GTPase
MAATMNKEDTICAVSTPHGMGGIAVIRVSGEDAANIVAKCWKGADISTVESHKAHLGKIVEPNGGETLDEVVMTIFRAPHSFTGEDVIEISCHGSMWIQQQIMKTLIDCGCRAATGGEFTRRAFMNGRMDLSQAEAVADLIASSSRASHRIAISQMRGDFSRKLNELREKLLHFVSLMELELDFSEEDVEFANRDEMIKLAEEIQNVIARLTDSFAVGNVIKNGLPVAIVGETNAGKSTLLNYLLHDDKALVSDIHGTTRDVIEDTITIAGTMFRFIDTAGIRETHDKIETMGIERTFRKIDEAQLVLWIIDGPAAISTEENSVEKLSMKIFPHCAGKDVIAVVNKVDLMSEEMQQNVKEELSRIFKAAPNESAPKTGKQIFISAKHQKNLNELEGLLKNAAALPENDENAVIVTNSRHYEALKCAGEAIARTLDGLHAGISGDFVSQDIRECMHYLGEITGEITTDDILGNVFKHFCIGK